MRFLAPPHQWFLKLTFLKTELWVYGGHGSEAAEKALLVGRMLDESAMSMLL
jgi:hypothetical protein